MVGGAKLLFNFIDGMHNRGMILAEFRGGVQQAQIGELPDQVHGDLTGLCGIFVPAAAADHGFADIIVGGNLGNNQLR